MGLIKRILRRENADNIEEFLKRKHSKKKWSDLLLEATGDANKELVKGILLTKEIDVNHQSNGLTPLIIASQEGYIKMVEFLLNYPEIDVNLNTNHGGTALIMACMTNQIEVVKLLLNHPNIDVNVATDRGATALILACFQGHRDIVELLLKRSEIDLSMRNNQGRTALDVAKVYGHKEIIQLMTNREGKNL